jgi:O-antigen/teichoic acid export membrane protein
MWSMGQQAMAWFVGNLPLLLLPFWFGLEATATLRAIGVLFMPVWQIVAAVSSAFLPMLSLDQPPEAFQRTLKTLLVLYIGISASYAALMLQFGDTVVGLVYGGKYHFDHNWFWMLAITPVFTSYLEAILLGFRARQRPDYGFWTYLLLSILSLCIIVPVIPVKGIAGAVGGSLVVWGVTAATAELLLRSKLLPKLWCLGRLLPNRP